MTTENEHLKHIITELDEIEDGISSFLQKHYTNVHDRVDSPLFSIEKRAESLISYVKRLSVVLPVPTGPVGLVKLCIDCEEEEANPGLDRCGECYSKCIRG